MEIDTLIVKTIAGEANSLLAAVGALESGVADTYWPLPKYREMLFMK